MPILQGNIDKSKELHNLGKIHSFFEWHDQDQGHRVSESSSP